MHPGRPHHPTPSLHHITLTTRHLAAPTLSLLIVLLAGLVANGKATDSTMAVRTML